MSERKSFESFTILLGLFLVLIASFNLNSAFLPKTVYYLAILVGVVLVVWGISMLNPRREEEWLADWEE